MSDQLATARAASVAAAYRRFLNSSVNGLEISEVHEELDPDDSGFHTHEDHNHMDYVEKEQSSIDHMSNKVQSKPYQEPDPDDCLEYQNKFEPDPDDSQGDETLVSKPFYSEAPGSRTISEPPHIASVATQLVAMSNSTLEATESCEEAKAALEHCFVAEPEPDQDMEILDRKIQAHKKFNEPDPDDLEAKLDNLGYENSMRPEDDSVDTRLIKDQFHQIKDNKNPDLVDSQTYGVMQAEPDPDDNLVRPRDTSRMQIDEPDPDDEELRRIQDPVTAMCSQLQKAVEVLRAEVNPTQATVILQTLFKIIRYLIKSYFL